MHASLHRKSFVNLLKYFLYGHEYQILWWWVLWENWPVQGSKHCCTYHIMLEMPYIKQRGYFMKDGRISGYFDTKCMTILQIENILHNFEDRQIAKFFNLEQVNFRVTLVICKYTDCIFIHRCLLRYYPHGHWGKLWVLTNMVLTH